MLIVIKHLQEKSFFFLMSIGQVPHLEMSPDHFTMATTVLFSASEQTQCTVTILVCDSE